MAQGWVVQPSCYPSVFGIDWDAVRTKYLLRKYDRQRDLGKFTEDCNIVFTDKGLLYFAGFHKDAANRLESLKHWLSLQAAAQSLKDSAF